MTDIGEEFDRRTLMRVLRQRIAATQADDLNRPEGGGTACAFGVPEVDQALPWGGVKLGALHEVLAENYRDRPAALGFVSGLAVRLLAEKSGRILWVQLDRGFQEFGQVYGPGLAGFGLDPARVIVVRARDEADVLWAVEEGLHCAGLAGVIAEVRADARAFDLTASRRLSMAADLNGVTAFLLRGSADNGAAAMSSAAATRWSISAAASAPLEGAYRGLVTGIGRPRWRVALTRCREGGRPRNWMMEWNHETHRFRLATPLANGSLLPRPAIASAVPEGHVLSGSETGADQTRAVAG